MNKEEKCPNPDGKPGICYSFDKYSDRAGCLGCPLYTTEMFEAEDPLPGLTKIIEKRMKEIEEAYADDTIAHMEEDINEIQR